MLELGRAVEGEVASRRIRRYSSAVWMDKDLAGMSCESFGGKGSSVGWSDQGTAKDAFRTF